MSITIIFKPFGGWQEPFPVTIGLQEPIMKAVDMFAAERCLQGAMFELSFRSPDLPRTDYETLRKIKMKKEDMLYNGSSVFRLLDNEGSQYSFHCHETPQQLNLHEDDTLELTVFLGAGGPGSFPEPVEVFNDAEGALQYYQTEIRRLRVVNALLIYKPQIEKNIQQHNLLINQRSSVARKGDVLDESEYECPICHRLLVKPCTLRCGHSFCLHCCHALFDATRNTTTTCPMCRQKVKPSCASNLAISYTLKKLLTTAFPSAYEQRLIEVRQEQHERQQARMEPNNDNHEAENPFAAAAAAVAAAAIDNGGDAFGATTGGAAARSTRTSYRGPDSTTPGTHNNARGGGDGGGRRMNTTSQSNRSTQRQRNTTPQRPTAGVTVTPNPTRTSHRGPDSTTPGTNNNTSGGGDGGDRRMITASQSNRSTQRQRPTAGVTVTPNPTRTSHRGPDSTTPNTNNNANGRGDGGGRHMNTTSQSNRSTQRQRNTTPQRPTAGVTPNPTPVTVSNSFEALFDDDED